MNNAKTKSGVRTPASSAIRAWTWQIAPHPVSDMFADMKAKVAYLFGVDHIHDHTAL